MSFPPVTYETFSQICESEGLTVHPEVQAAGERGRSTDPDFYAPTGMLAAIVECGHVLRRDPRQELVTAPVTYTFADKGSDIPAKTLRAVLNASHGIITTAAVNISNGHKSALPAGSENEEIFARLLTDIEQDDHPVGEIFAERGKALFLRRGGEDPGEPPTALTLTRQMAIGGVIFPQFTLVRLDAVGDAYSDKGMPVIENNDLAVRDAGDIVSATPLRLTSFSLSQATRAAHFGRLESHEIEFNDRKIRGVLRACLNNRPG